MYKIILNTIFATFLSHSMLVLIMGQNINNRSLDLSDADKIMKFPETFIIDEKIDPNTYILGPADKLGLSIMTNSHLTYILTITPSGKLWLPEIGVVSVSGITIPEAETKVRKFIQDNKYNDADIDLVLLNIRKYKVQISGAVISPGFINISSIERLSDLVNRAGGLHKLANEETITIIRNKNNIICSLKSYQIDGNLFNNPMLKEGDVIHVPYNDAFIDVIQESISYKKSLVLVTGYVVNPGGHKYIPGYTIMDYIGLSGGISDMGSINKISIYRNEKEIKVLISDQVRPGDQIIVPSNIKFRYLGNISILQTLTAVTSLILTFVAATK